MQCTINHENENMNFKYSNGTGVSQSHLYQIHYPLSFNLKKKSSASHRSSSSPTKIGWQICASIKPVIAPKTVVGSSLWLQVEYDHPTNPRSKNLNATVILIFVFSCVSTIPLQVTKRKERLGYFSTAWIMNMLSRDADLHKFSILGIRESALINVRLGEYSEATQSQR